MRGSTSQNTEIPGTEQPRRGMSGRGLSPEYDGYAAFPLGYLEILEGKVQ